MVPSKFVFIPDSFKGTMSSAEVCEVMETAVRRHFPEARTVSIPVADGGEGSVEAFVRAVGGQEVRLTVSGPFGEPVNVKYAILRSGEAVIEMASCAGLPLVDGRTNPEKTTTYGVGEQILDAVRRGCRTVIVGLGGSCTTDGGCGAASACGTVFLDKSGNPFVPVGGTLKDIREIRRGSLIPRDVRIVTMCDVDNPLCGQAGAAYVFGPQKGADPEMVVRLDGGLAHLACTIRRDLGAEILDLPGAGAAGGMGAGMVAFFGSELKMGIETVLDTTGFDREVSDADFVFTGEGKIDSQSLRGKVVMGVARRCARLGTQAKVIAFVGDIEGDISECYRQGVCAVFSTNRRAVPFSEARLSARPDLEDTIDNFTGLIARL